MNPATQNSSLVFRVDQMEMALKEIPKDATLYHLVLAANAFRQLDGLYNRAPTIQLKEKISLLKSEAQLRRKVITRALYPPYLLSLPSELRYKIITEAYPPNSLLKQDIHACLNMLKVLFQENSSSSIIGVEAEAFTNWMNDNQIPFECIEGLFNESDRIELLLRTPFLNLGNNCKFSQFNRLALCSNLKILNVINRTISNADLYYLKNLENLTSVNLGGCTSISTEGLFHLKKVTHLNLSACKEVNLVELVKLKTLSSLEIEESDLVNSSGLTNIQSLKIIVVRQPEIIEHLMSFENLTKLELCFYGNPKSNFIESINKIIKLESIILYRFFPSQKDTIDLYVIDFKPLDKMSSLRIEGPFNLMLFKGLPKNLKSLKIFGCKSILTMEQLQSLVVKQCPQLKDFEMIEPENFDRVASLTSLSRFNHNRLDQLLDEP